MIRAIIFDLDGTLADTEQLHFAAFNQILTTRGITISREEYFSVLIGLDDHDCFAQVMREHGPAASESEIARMMAAKADAYQEMIRSREVLYPGAASFVRQCASRFPLSIVTGTLRTEAEMIITRAQLRDLFVDIVAAEDVEHGKPAPDAFIAAIGRLGFLLRYAIPPKSCLVIEDTAAGVQAARRAGMRVLALRQTNAAADFSEADLVRESIGSLDLDDLLRRLPHQ